MAYVVVSDIHGEHQKFKDMLDFGYVTGLIPIANITLVCLGDMIDIGPDSYNVWNLFRMWSQYKRWKHARPIILRGNHEQMMIDAFRSNSQATYLNWYEQGGKETYRSFMEYSHDIGTLTLDQMEEAVAFFEQLPLYHETDKYIFVHAGLRPGVPLDKQEHDDLLWIRGTFINSDYDWGKRVIFGHTPAPKGGLWFMSNKIGIDTLKDGYLTALIINDDDSLKFITSHGVAYEPPDDVLNGV